MLVLKSTIEVILKPLTLHKMQVAKLQILGYSNTHEYGWDETYGEDDDEVTVTIEGTSVNYNDANWNWLGSSWSDVYGEGYNSNVVVDGERIETGNLPPATR